MISLAQALTLSFKHKEAGKGFFKQLLKTITKGTKASPAGKFALGAKDTERFFNANTMSQFDEVLTKQPGALINYGGKDYALKDVASKVKGLKRGVVPTDNIFKELDKAAGEIVPKGVKSVPTPVETKAITSTEIPEKKLFEGGKVEVGLNKQPVKEYAADIENKGFLEKNRKAEKTLSEKVALEKTKLDGGEADAFGKNKVKNWTKRYTDFYDKDPLKAIALTGGGLYAGNKMFDSFFD